MPLCADIHFSVSEWLDSEKLSRQHKRHIELQKTRAKKACRFLLNDAKFTEWRSGIGCQQLAIVGELGSGKSVAMAYLVDVLQRSSLRVCYHYCQNGTSGDAIHVFCVLILSLLEQIPRLKKPFVEWYDTLASGMDPAPSFKSLEGWLKKTLKTLGHRLIFAIDGLDECDEKSRRELLASLKAISEKAPNLNLLFSTRPEEAILEQLKEMSEIPMACNVERDSLIAKKIVKTSLSYLDADVKTLIVDSLSRSAQGSALWTKMTIDLIAMRRMTAPDPIRAFLTRNEQPKDLWDLYTNVYSRQTRDNHENQVLVTTALEVLAIARRPLSILELGWAAALGAADETIRTVNDLSKLVDCKMIMSLIHPFVARVDFADLAEHQVRLVHPSVREFVVGSPTLHGSRRADLSGSVAKSPAAVRQHGIERLEASLLAICIRYLLLEEIGNNTLFSEECSSLEELSPDVDLFIDGPAAAQVNPNSSWDDWEREMAHFNPAERGFGELFTYASCHWIEHLSAVSTTSLLPSLADMEMLCRAGSTRLDNWIAQNCRPGCTIQPRFAFDSGLYDPLSITCLYGSDAMLQRVLGEADLSGAGDVFLPDTVVKAADQILQWSDLDRIKVLWESEPGRQQLRGLKFFCLVLEQWWKSPAERYRAGWDGVLALLDDVCDKMVEDQWGRIILSKAIVVGCLPVVQRLFEAARSRPALMAELGDMSQGDMSEGDISLIETAVLANDADILKYLLRQQDMKAHVEHRDACGRDMLCLATRFCNPAVFRVLVPRLEECVNKRDPAGQTVLDRVVWSGAASEEDQYQVAHILAAWGRFLETRQVEPLVAKLRLIMGIRVDS